MTRFFPILAAAVLGAAANAQAAEHPFTDQARSARDAGTTVERLLDEGIAYEWAPSAGEPVLASAAGGVLGWFFPQIYAWYPKLDGEMGEVGGDALRFDEDLALSDRELSVVPAIQLQLGGWGVRFSAFFLEFSGSNVINREFTFGGVTFPVNELVESNIKLDNYRLLTVKPIVNTDVIVLAITGGVSWYSFDGSVSSQTIGTGRESGDVPIPVIGALLQAKVAMFVLEVDISGLSISIGGIQADLLELQASVGVVLFKVVTLRGGYRMIDLRGESSDLYVDATLEGFFVGAGFNF